MAKSGVDFVSRRLFDTISNTNSGVSVEALEDTLARNKPKIQSLLDFYKTPSEASRKVVKSGKVTIGTRELIIDEEMKSFSLWLSEICMLDEVQTVELFHNFNKTILIGQSIQYDVVFADRVLGYYFEERSYLLRAVIALFRNVGDHGHEFQAAIGRFLSPEFQATLTRALFTQLQSLVDFELPKNMDLRWKHRWALQNLREQSLVLEALFYAHYDNTKYSPQNVLDAFKALRSCGTLQRHSALFGAQGEILAKRVTYLSVFLLLEMLNLEEFSLAASNENEPRSKFVEDMLVQGVLMNLHAEVTSHWKSLVEHGPILAGVSALTLYCNLISDHDTLDDTELLKYAVENLNLFAYLSEIAKYGIDKDEFNSLGHKSVLLGFLASLLDLVNVEVLDQARFTCVVDLFVAVFEKSPLLASQFWSNTTHMSLRLFVDNATKRFPYDYASFVRILTALASSEETAREAFLAFKEVVIFADYFAKLPSFAAGVQIDDESVVVAEEDFNLNLIRIPKGTKGKVFVTPDMGEIVRWELAYSGWHLSFALLDQFHLHSSHAQLDTTRLEAVKALIAFLDRLVYYDRSIPHLLHEYLLAVKAPHVIYKRLKSSIALKLALIFETIAFAPNADLTLLASILDCITGFIDADSRDAAAVVRAIRPEHFRRILDYLECPSADYSVTIAALAFIRTVLYSTLMWSLEDESQANVDISDHVNYITAHVWPLYDSWRYLIPSQRHQIADRILLIFDEILSDNFSSARSSYSIEEPLKVRLQRALLNDSSFHANLLKIIGIGPNFIESKILEEPSEGVILSGMVCTAFEILKRVLYIRASEKGPITSLENALLSRRPDGSDLVLTISLFINFVRDQKLVQSAVQVLTELCRLSASYQRPISLLGYFESRKMELRSQFLHRLGDRDLDLALRIAVIEFIVTAIETQPGLATLFFLPRLKAEGEEDDEDDIATRARLNNCVEIVSRFIIIEGKLTYNRRPQVLASFLSLLAQLWRNAPQHAPIIAKFRKIEKFWSTIVYFSTENPNEKRPQDAPENVVEFQSERLRISSYIFEILLFELFYVPTPSRLDAELSEALTPILKDSTRTRSWINYYSASNFDEELDARFHKLCAVHNVKSSQLLSAESQKHYGRQFQYDSILLRRHFGFPENEDVSSVDVGMHWEVFMRLDPTEKARVFIATVEEQNLQLSRLEAQLQAAQSWRHFAEVALLRHAELGLLSNFEIRFDAAVHLAKTLGNQRPTLKLMNQEVAELLLVVTRELTKSPLANEYEDKTIGFLAHLQDALKVALSAKEIDERLVLPLTTTILLVLTAAPRSTQPPKEFWTTKFAANALMITPFLFTVLREVLSARLVTLSALTLVIQRVKAVEDLEHLIEAELHSPIRLVLDILTDALAAMPIVESSIHAKTPDKKESSTESDGDVMELVVPTTTGPDVASAASLLLITLTRSQLLSEAMINEGVLSVLRSDRLVTARFYPYTVDGKRSAWHQVWLAIVRLTSALLIALGANSRILDQIIDIVHVHENRLVSALTIPFHRAKDPLSLKEIAKKASLKVETQKSDTPTDIEVLSLGGLEELDVTVAFLYHLGVYERLWSFAERELANDHIKLMVNLLEWTIHLLTDNERLAAFVVPVSNEEKKLAQPPRTEKVKEGAVKEVRESEFLIRARNSVNKLAVDAMCYLRMMLPVPSDETTQIKKQVRAFTPLFEATSSVRHPPTPASVSTFSDEYSPPSLAIFLEYFKFIDAQLLEMEKDKDKSRGQESPVLLTFTKGVEQALYLVLTHVNVYLGPSLAAYHLAVATIVIEMNNFLASVQTSLAQLAPKNDVSKIISIAVQYFNSLREKFSRRVHTVAF